MPTPASKRGTRARPESTTAVTPSTVSEVSARSVDSTTLRRPAGAGATAESWASAGSEPWSRWTSTAARPSAPLRSSAWAVRLISPIPGRNTRTSPDDSDNAVSIAEVVTASRRSRRCLGRQRTATGWVRPGAEITGAGTGEPAAAAGPLAPRRLATSPTLRVADITITRRSGRNKARASRVSARPRSAASDRSWNSSKITSEVPSRPGSP